MNADGGNPTHVEFAPAAAVSRANGGYSAFFDTNDFQGVVPSMPGARLREASDVAAWLAALPTLKQAMDLAQPGEEREVQQHSSSAKAMSLCVTEAYEPPLAPRWIVRPDDVAAADRIAESVNRAPERHDEGVKPQRVERGARWGTEARPVAVPSPALPHYQRMLGLQKPVARHSRHS